MVESESKIQEALEKEAANALQESIKRKGDKSYYYAHAPRNVDDPTLATIIEGEGIVTGGDPKLLVKDLPKMEPVKQVINIRNYHWHDDDDKIRVSTPFEDTEDKVTVKFEKEGFELIHEASPTETRKLIIKSLNKPINPEASSYRIRNRKVVIILMKEDVDSTWYNLTKN
ncbi:hypothetical protein SteCoe_19429 [Stentor coeruleus]|uniref:CS domain-containing protein n=1 Tax=Stentor coeruleus TaxID=5963 RepID=A0A1R2BUG4_9CILI|nr:hypothetical protein SteCoe_19429 [Stentor coeruleus]